MPETAAEGKVLAALALHHQIAVPQVMGSSKGVAFLDAPARCVVGVADGLGGAVADNAAAHQLVVGVPAVVGFFMGTFSS